MRTAGELRSSRTRSRWPAAIIAANTRSHSLTAIPIQKPAHLPCPPRRSSSIRRRTTAVLACRSITTAVSGDSINDAPQRHGAIIRNETAWRHPAEAAAREIPQRVDSKHTYAVISWAIVFIKMPARLAYRCAMSTQTFWFFFRSISTWACVCTKNNCRL